MIELYLLYVMNNKQKSILQNQFQTLKIKIVHDQAIRHNRLGRNQVLWQILKQFPLECFTHILKHSLEPKNP